MKYVLIAALSLFAMGCTEKVQVPPEEGAQSPTETSVTVTPPPSQATAPEVTVTTVTPPSDINDIEDEDPRVTAAQRTAYLYNSAVPIEERIRILQVELQREANQQAADVERARAVANISLTLPTHNFAPPPDPRVAELEEKNERLQEDRLAQQRIAAVQNYHLGLAEGELNFRRNQFVPVPPAHPVPIGWVPPPRDWRRAQTGAYSTFIESVTLDGAYFYP